MKSYSAERMRGLDRRTIDEYGIPGLTLMENAGSAVVRAAIRLSAAVSNSLVADGCIIEGRVENCIVFRGVRIGLGAVVKNSIIMQGSYIGNGADLDYCICDKGVLVADNRRLAGYATYPLYIPRDTRV